MTEQAAERPIKVMLTPTEIRQLVNGLRVAETHYGTADDRYGWHVLGGKIGGYLGQRPLLTVRDGR